MGCLLIQASAEQNCVISTALRPHTTAQMALGLGPMESENESKILECKTKSIILKLFIPQSRVK